MSNPIFPWKARMEWDTDVNNYMANMGLQIPYYNIDEKTAKMMYDSIENNLRTKGKINEKGEFENDAQITEDNQKTGINQVKRNNKQTTEDD